MGRRGVGMTQNIMRAFYAVIRPDHFKFASYGPGVEDWDGSKADLAKDKR